MAIDDSTPYEGRRRRPQPDTRVERDDAIDLRKSFDVFTDEIRVLNQTMRGMRRDLKANLDAQSRFSVNSRSTRAYQDARRSVDSDQSDPLAGIIYDAMAIQNWNEYHRRTGRRPPQNQSLGPSFEYYVDPRRPMSGRQGTQSLTHFQTWVAQRLGEQIAGHPDVYNRDLSGVAPDPYVGQHRRGSAYQGRHRQGVPIDPNAGQPKIAQDGSEGDTGGISGSHVAGGLTAASAALRTRIGSVVAQSGGTLAGMGAAVQRLPAIGLAVTAGIRGTEFYQSQREQARSYQEMTGTTGAEGWWTKRQEDLYRWTNPFAFSGARAREQFQTVTALGYNDLGPDAGLRTGSRAQALEFMDQAYHHVGMDTDESGRVLEAASRNTQTNIDELADALQRLSQSAGEAGINAMKARQNFLHMFESATNQGYGSSALSTAEILTNTQIAYGKTFENTDLSGTISQGQIALLAAQTGQTYGETQGMLRNDPARYMMAAGGNFVEHLRNLNPEFARAVEEAVAGEDVSSEAVRNRIKNELIGPGGPFANADLDTQAAAMSQLTGIPMNREQFVDAAITELGGHGLGAQGARQQRLNSSRQAGGIADVFARGGSPLMNEAIARTKTDVEFGLGITGTPLSELSRDEQADIIRRGAENYAENGGVGLSEEGQVYAQYRRNLVGILSQNDGTLTGPSEAVSQYNRKYLERGRQDPFLEALLMNLGPNQEDAMVEVELAGGGTRVVSLGEAMQHYGDALASGQVRFVNGELAGKTTADVAGMQGTGDYDPVGDENTTNERLDELGVGVSGEEWRRENPQEASGGSQRVTIELSPDAERLFRVVQSDPNAAANAGSPVDMGDLDISRYPSQQPN